MIVKVLEHQEAIEYLKRAEQCFSGVMPDNQNDRAALLLRNLVQAERLFLEQKIAAPTEVVITETGFPSTATLEADIQSIWQKGPRLKPLLEKALALEPLSVKEGNEAILPHSLIEVFCQGEKVKYEEEQEEKEKGILGSRRTGSKTTVEIEKIYEWSFSEGSNVFWLKQREKGGKKDDYNWLGGFRYFDGDNPFLLHFGVGDCYITKVYSNIATRKQINNLQEKILHIGKIFCQMPLDTPLDALQDLVDYRTLWIELRKAERQKKVLEGAKEKLEELSQLNERLRKTLEQKPCLRELFLSFLEEVQN